MAAGYQCCLCEAGGTKVFAEAADMAADLSEWGLGMLGVPLWSVVLAVGLVALFAVIQKRNGGRKSSNLPPGPPPLPVLGNLLIFATSRLLHRDLAKMAAKYGKIMWMKLGTKGAIVVSSPAMAREVLKTRDAVFASRSPTYATSELLFKNIAFAPYGPHLLHSRKVMATELVSAKRIKQFEGIRLGEVAAVIATIRSHISTFGTGRPSPVNVTFLLELLTLNTVTRMAISKRFFDYHVQEGTGKQPTSAANKDVGDVETFVSLLQELIATTPTQLLRDCIPCLSIFDNLNPVKHRIPRIRKRFDAVLTAVIEEHRKELRRDSGRSAKDYLDVLLQLNEEEQLSNDAIKGQITDILVAGTDITSATMAWAMAELLRHPAILERAEKEVNSVVSSDQQVSDAHLPRLPYLQAIVKETLRLHPGAPVLLPHCSVEATKVAGYDIPAQTVVFVNAWAISTDPAVWKDSLEFIPERFIDRPDVDVRGHNFEVIPFGSGRRGCPGMNLALLMVPHTLATLLHSFSWSLPDDVKRPQDLDMSETQGFTMARVDPLQVVFSLRHG